MIQLVPSKLKTMSLQALPSNDEGITHLLIITFSESAQMPIKKLELKLTSAHVVELKKLVDSADYSKKLPEFIKSNKTIIETEMLRQEQTTLNMDNQSMNAKR